MKTKRLFQCRLMTEIRCSNGLSYSGRPLLTFLPLMATSASMIPSQETCMPHAVLVYSSLKAFVAVHQIALLERANTIASPRLSTILQHG